MVKRIIFLKEPSRPGAFHMARDYHLLKKMDDGSKNSGYFTLYRFSPTCLSLGRFQKLQPALERKCLQLGIDIVRRPTGGKAVLHGQHEITYSLVLPAAFGFKPGQVLSTYQKLKPVFLQVLATLGIKPDAEHTTFLEKTEIRDLCFASIQAPDVTVNGKKVFGNALLWGKNAFLIHGSLCLEFPERELTALYSRSLALKLKERSFCLSQARPLPDFEELEEAFRKALLNEGYTITEAYLDQKTLKEIQKLASTFAL
jgi:lipoate-protein ligase A